MYQSLTDHLTTWPEAGDTDTAELLAMRAPEPSCAETDGIPDTETAPA